MYGMYANIGGILMVNVPIYSIHGSYGYINVWFLFPTEVFFPSSMDPNTAWYCNIAIECYRKSSCLVNHLWWAMFNSNVTNYPRVENTIFNEIPAIQYHTHIPSTPPLQYLRACLDSVLPVNLHSHHSAIENGPFIVSFPIKNGGSFHSYVSLPEGIFHSMAIIGATISATVPPQAWLSAAPPNSHDSSGWANTNRKAPARAKGRKAGSNWRMIQESSQPLGSSESWEVKKQKDKWSVKLLTKKHEWNVWEGIERQSENDWGWPGKQLSMASGMEHRLMCCRNWQFWSWLGLIRCLVASMWFVSPATTNMISMTATTTITTVINVMYFFYFK